MQFICAMAMRTFTSFLFLGIVQKIKGAPYPDLRIKDASVLQENRLRQITLRCDFQWFRKVFYTFLHHKKCLPASIGKKTSLSFLYYAVIN